MHTPQFGLHLIDSYFQISHVAYYVLRVEVCIWCFIASLHVRCSCPASLHLCPTSTLFKTCSSHKGLSGSLMQVLATSRTRTTSRRSLRRSTDSDMSSAHQSHSPSSTIPAFHGQAALTASVAASAAGQHDEQLLQKSGHAEDAGFVKVQRSLTWTEGTASVAAQVPRIQLQYSSRAHCCAYTDHKIKN